MKLELKDNPNLGEIREILRFIIQELSLEVDEKNIPKELKKNFK